MFIATKQNQYLFAPLGAKHRNSARISYLGCRAPTERRFFGAGSGYKHLAPLGRSNRMACCTSMNLRMTNDKWKIRFLLLLLATAPASCLLLPSSRILQ